MRVQPRDMLATFFVAVSLVVYAAWAVGAAIPGLVEVGAVALAVLALGIAASVSAVVPGFWELLRGSKLYLATASVVGVLAFAGGLWALISGDAVALGLLVLATLALWTMSTVRHSGVHLLEHRLGHR